MNEKNYPKGNTTINYIRGKARMYLQWTENGVQKNKYIRTEDQAEILSLVAERDLLENNYFNSNNKNVEGFLTNVIYGENLVAGVLKVASYKKRECFNILESYLKNDNKGKVCLLYGLRRTGKTTIILQAIKDLPYDQTAYIKVMSYNTIDELNSDLKLLSKRNFKYIFIDEVTLLKDFIDNASLFSDIYSIFGMKVVLSGTDSLGFAISNDEELYDRTVIVHTTFIPFREYSRLLNIHDIDEYIRYGGTFKMGEKDFVNKEIIGDCTFLNEETTRHYIDSAIAKNIQHSLSCYQAGNHFRHLLDLYENNELTSAINRIVEDINHHFVISVITNDFVSHDLGSIKQIARKKSLIENQNNILDKVNQEIILKSLKELLEIKNRNELKSNITNDHVLEIKEYLTMLDLILDIPTYSIGTKTPIEGVVFSQPGLRYCQAKALVCSLEKDDIFKNHPIAQRKQLTQTILDDVSGRILEEIVLLETVKTLPSYKKAFKLFFKTGEFDMVIFNEKELSCEIFEVKHSKTITKEQYKHLINKEKCQQTEFEFGKITKRCVLYRDDNTTVGDIEYRNVEDYLLKLNSLNRSN